MTMSDFAQVEQVLVQLKNAKAKVKERCVMHIHVDGSGFDL
jgi:hypothetical protein